MYHGGDTFETGSPCDGASGPICRGIKHGAGLLLKGNGIVGHAGERRDGSSSIARLPVADGTLLGVPEAVFREIRMAWRWNGSRS